ncbi:MAG: 4-hydroxy-tetrahydrodipicolinate reductase [Oscillospiraceae bacterium]
MPKIIISGCNGRMGQVVTRMCAAKTDMEVVAGFDLNAVKLSTYPVYADPMEFSGAADVIIDFSNSASLEPLLAYCKRRKMPVVICTTGHSPEQLQLIADTAKEIPIFRSGNMSLGINLLTHLLKKAAAVLGADYDVEIIERHHRTKVDAPSGTAIMLANAIAEALPYKPEYVYERESVRRVRGEHEIGISAIRGGTIVGEHEVLFCGPDEVIEFTHKAYSREVFANGAVAAAKYMAGITKPGMYDMNNVLAGIL